MRFVFVGYTSNPQYHDPIAWLFRIRAYLGVLEALAKEHTVTSIEQIGYTGALEQNNVQYHFIRPVSRRDYFPSLLHHFIAAQSPDIILVHGMEHPLQLMHLRSTVGKRVKIIVQSHSTRLPTGLKKWIQRIADNSTNAYCFTARQMALPWLQEKLIRQPEKIFELPVGSSVFKRMNKSIARARTGVDAEKIFLWAGRLDTNKDPLTVVKAFLHFASLEPAVKLYMIFQQDELLNAVQQLLLQHPAGNQVVLVGAVAHDAMQEWFCSADYFISTSYFEVYGVAVVEAISCGCIPLLSDIPAYRAISANGACGLLFPPGDADALLQVLQRSLQLDTALEEAKTLTAFHGRLGFAAIAAQLAGIAASLRVE